MQHLRESWCRRRRFLRCPHRVRIIFITFHSHFTPDRSFSPAQPAPPPLTPHTPIDYHADSRPTFINAPAGRLQRCQRRKKSGKTFQPRPRHGKLRQRVIRPIGAHFLRDPAISPEKNGPQTRGCPDGLNKPFKKNPRRAKLQTTLSPGRSAPSSAEKPQHKRNQLFPQKKKNVSSNDLGFSVGADDGSIFLVPTKK